MVDLYPAEWPRFDLQRLERYLQSVLKGLRKPSAAARR